MPIPEKRDRLDAGFPELETPELEMPGLEMPGLEMPGLEMPGLEMNVTIQSINSQESVPVPGTAQLGHPAEFETPVVTGFATVVPCAGESENLAAGKSIEVDAKHDYISRYAALDDTAPPKIEPLETKGDYLVQGPVIFRYDAGTFGVEVGGFIFTLNRNDARGQLPDIEQSVSFHLHGLSLWDRGTL